MLSSTEVEVISVPPIYREPETYVSPLNITLKASDKLPEEVPFPITKAGADVENEDELVAEEPEELYCPITVDA